MIPPLLNITTEEWIEHHHRALIGGGEARGLRWRGIRIQKFPVDLLMLQEAIWDRRPGVIIEIGTKFGGSAVFMADMMGLYRWEYLVITVDKNHDLYPLAHDHVAKVTGLSQSADTAQRVRGIVDRRVAPTMVVHDGGHAADQVAADLRLYADMVSAGQLLVVEDTIIDQLSPDGPIGFAAGPLTAVNQFLQENPSFRRVDKYDRFRLSYNHGGWLERIT